jgi:hypothetical protein
VVEAEAVVATTAPVIPEVIGLEAAVARVVTEVLLVFL